jgi:TonB family protein
LAQQFDHLLAQTLKYPQESRKQGIEEIVYVSLDVDEDGELRSFEILQSPNPSLRNEVDRSFKLIQKSWKKRFLED